MSSSRWHLYVPDEQVSLNAVTHHVDTSVPSHSLLGCRSRVQVSTADLKRCCNFLTSGCSQEMALEEKCCCAPKMKLTDERKIINKQNAKRHVPLRSGIPRSVGTATQEDLLAKALDPRSFSLLLQQAAMLTDMSRPMIDKPTLEGLYSLQHYPYARLLSCPKALGPDIDLAHLQTQVLPSGHI